MNAILFIKRYMEKEKLPLIAGSFFMSHRSLKKRKNPGNADTLSSCNHA